MTKLFPTLIIALNTCAALVYLFKGDYARAFYWGCAAGLNVSITWWMK